MAKHESETAENPYQAPISFLGLGMVMSKHYTRGTVKFSSATSELVTC